MGIDIHQLRDQFAVFFFWIADTKPDGPLLVQAYIWEAGLTGCRKTAKRKTPVLIFAELFSGSFLILISFMRRILGFCKAPDKKRPDTEVLY